MHSVLYCTYVGAFDQTNAIFFQKQNSLPDIFDANGRRDSPCSLEWTDVNSMLSAPVPVSSAATAAAAAAAATAALVRAAVDIFGILMGADGKGACQKRRRRGKRTLQFKNTFVCKMVDTMKRLDSSERRKVFSKIDIVHGLWAFPMPFFQGLPTKIYA